MIWGFRTIAATCMCALCACYSYAPVEIEAVSPGEAVRVTITREAAERFGSALSRPEQTFEGEVVQAEPGSLWVNVTTSMRRSGFQFQRMAQTLRFTQGETVDVELKVLNKRRTAVTTATAAVLVSAVAWAALGGKAGGRKTLPPGDPTSDAKIIWIVPVLRLSMSGR